MTLSQRLNQLIAAITQLATATAQNAMANQSINQKLSAILLSQQKLEREVLANTLALQKLSDAMTQSQQALVDMFQFSKHCCAEVNGKLDQILDILNHQLRTMTLRFFDEHGNPLTQENGMPFQLTDGGAGSHLFVVPSETDAAGNPVTVDPTKIGYAVSDATALTLTVNNGSAPMDSPDVPGQQIAPGGCEVAAVAAAGHLGSFQITGTDSSNNLSVQDNITVVSGAATVLGINGTVV